MKENVSSTADMEESKNESEDNKVHTANVWGDSDSEPEDEEEEEQRNRQITK